MKLWNLIIQLKFNNTFDSWWLWHQWHMALKKESKLFWSNLIQFDNTAVYLFHFFIFLMELSKLQRNIVPTSWFQVVYKFNTNSIWKTYSYQMMYFIFWLHFWIQKTVCRFVYLVFLQALQLFIPENGNQRTLIK